MDTVEVNGPEGVAVWMGRRRLACPRGERNEVAAQDLQGDAGAGLGRGPVLAEIDVGFLVEHVGQCATGDPAQCWASDGRDRWGDCPVDRGPSGYGGAGASIRVRRGSRCRSGVCTFRRPTANARPLGIPVVMDRCHQARVRTALEPEWEARFEARSYRVSSGPRLRRCDRLVVHHAQRATSQTGVDSGRRSCRPRSTESTTPGSSRARVRSPPGI